MFLIFHLVWILVQIEIELLTDITQCLMVENNIRGGLSFIGDRFVEIDDSDKLNELIFSVDLFSVIFH